MRTMKVSALAVLAALAMGGVAQAQDADPPIDLSFNIGATTDYVFRGVSQSDEDPAVFGGVDATLGAIGYAGVWASTVDFGDSTDLEVDVYAGVRPTVGAVSLDLGVIYYGYVDAPSGSDYGYWEGKVAASMPLGPATFGAAAYYSPDFFGGTGDAVYYEANFSSSIPQTRFSVSGALGRQTVEGPGDYTTWNLGVGYALTDNLGFDVRYFDTAEHGFGEIFDSRVVGSVKLAF